MNIYNAYKQLKKSTVFSCYHGTIVCVVHSKPKWGKDQILLVLLHFRKGIFQIWRVTCELHGIWKVILWHKVEEHGLEGNVQSMMQHKKLTSSWFVCIQFKPFLHFWWFDVLWCSHLCVKGHNFVNLPWKWHLLKLLIKVKCKICRAKALGCGAFSK
jgi:hypothetical protein